MFLSFFVRQVFCACVGAAFLCTAAQAGPLRDRLLERRAAQQEQGLEDDGPEGTLTLPAGARVLRDVAYGPDALQRMDVYLPAHPVGAPVLFMVHGGAWRVGDKAAAAVVQNKLARWVGQGSIFVSVNYRMLPQADVLVQAQDVARALAVAQQQAAGWGGDAGKFILMGHSAGAHLVALLDAAPSLAPGVRPWLGTVALDSAALDVVQIMQARHMRLYDTAFGSDPAFWRQVSPAYVLQASAAPLLAVCSTRRSDSCAQARQFVDRATALGVHATVLEQDLSHRDINQQLGLESGYTRAVESFMGALDATVQRLLAPH
jgi:arylformamidase